MVLYHIWCFCGIWFVLPNYLVHHFTIDKVDAGIRSGVFIALATFLRPIGGMIGDKFNAVKGLMMDFIFLIIGAIILGVSDHIALFTIGCLMISVCAGIEMVLYSNLYHHTFLKNQVLRMASFL